MTSTKAQNYVCVPEKFFFLKSFVFFYLKIIQVMTQLTAPDGNWKAEKVKKFFGRDKTML